MSAHYSKFALNTYAGTPYFEANLPAGYPIHKVLQKSRAYRRLPPNLRELSRLAQQWADRVGRYYVGIEEWYDEDGYELDPASGQRLTDREIDGEWDLIDDGSLDNFVVKDIPRSKFTDPLTWDRPQVLITEDRPTAKQIKRDVLARGSAAVAKEYGVEPVQSFDSGEDSDTVSNAFYKRAESVLDSSYFSDHEDERSTLIEALASADVYEDLGVLHQDIFDRAEILLRQNDSAWKEF